MLVSFNWKRCKTHCAQIEQIDTNQNLVQNIILHIETNSFVTDVDFNCIARVFPLNLGFMGYHLPKCIPIPNVMFYAWCDDVMLAIHEQHYEFRFL